MKFEKLTVHPVEDWKLSSIVIISSTDYPELGFLVWGEEHIGGGTEIHIHVAGIKKPFKTRMVCGGCNPYLKDNKDIIYNEDRKNRIESFLQAIRKTCQQNGITTLIFQKWNRLQQVVYPGIELEQDVDDVHFHDANADDLDRTRLEEVFVELSGVEFRMRFFQSYYEKRNQIRAAKNAVAQLCRQQQGDGAWPVVRCSIATIHKALVGTTVKLGELEPTENKHIHSCRWSK